MPVIHIFILQIKKFKKWRKKSWLWSDEEQGLKYRLHSSILKLNLRNLKVLWRLEKEENGQLMFFNIFLQIKGSLP